MRIEVNEGVIGDTIRDAVVRALADCQDMLRSKVDVDSAKVHVRQDPHRYGLTFTVEVGVFWRAI